MLTYAEKPERVLPPAPRKLPTPEPEGMVKKEKVKVQRSAGSAPKKEEKPPTPELEEVAPVKREKAKYETDRPTPYLPKNTFLCQIPHFFTAQLDPFGCERVVL